MSIELMQLDPWLEPHADALQRRSDHIEALSARILNGTSIEEFSLGHMYFGLHQEQDVWIMREWAPHATRILLVGDHNDWDIASGDAFERQADIWTLTLSPGTLRHGMRYKLYVEWDGGAGYRLPAYARYVVQDPETKLFAAEVWAPKTPFAWTDHNFAPSGDVPLIYEAHIGMSSEREEVASYRFFAEHVLPRIKQAGYNTVQLMAIAEHPYYGSFGYHVSNYFAPSSRFGTPDELKELVNTAHSMGLRVIMDMVHSHSVKNEAEGLSRFDGSLDQYFHGDERGYHQQWDSRVFDYGKSEVAHFLLSNCRFWLDEFHFDGYRFDGITSMLYHSHGLEKSFSSYDDYFSDDTNLDALTYLAMANQLIHTIKPDALTIAEDMSAMPGLAAKSEAGGIGFDYRLSMGVPDLWIKTLKHLPDEDWPLDTLLHELTTRRPEEHVISYTESHDQALVGDKTLIFRLADKEMYDHMQVADTDLTVERAVALHKMIRLLTAATNGGGYLNFMGNEFGHPEWIDFPREDNDWSYKYARRQWSLVDNTTLKYSQLGAFDQAMLETIHKLSGHIGYIHTHQKDGVIAFARNEYVFAFNFSPQESYTDYGITAPRGNYTIALASDDARFGGQDRVDTSIEYHTRSDQLLLYLPARTAVVLHRRTQEIL